jgi:ribA/ribD-fused uncharacterized protein
MAEQNKYVFFWKENEANGIFSQWYPSKIVEGKIEFNCAEHYMMYHKALLFNDIPVANRILKTDKPDIIKKLGRSVKNFNEEVWKQNREKIVYSGNKLKFQQNNVLCEKLKKFPVGTIFVEASPYDNIWGIGYKHNNAVQNKASWGMNLLGKIITKLHTEMKDK